MTRYHSAAATDPRIVDAALRELFRTLLARPLPEVFHIMVDQLDERPPERVAA